MGTGAVMTSLRRTYACGVKLEDCYTLEQLDEMSRNGELEKALIPVDRLLEDYPAVTVTDNQAVRFKNGGDLMVSRVRGLKDFGFYRVYGLNGFLGLGEYAPDSESLKVKRVYNNI